MERPNGVDFDAHQALIWIVADDVPFLNRLIGVDLCPVGFGSRMFLLVSPGEEFVLLHDEWLLFRRYASLVDALDAVFFRKGRDEEPIWISDPDKPIGFRRA